jgi:hypothetical protein
MRLLIICVIACQSACKALGTVLTTRRSPILSADEVYGSSADAMILLATTKLQGLDPGEHGARASAQANKACTAIENASPRIAWWRASSRRFIEKLERNPPDGDWGHTIEARGRNQKAGARDWVQDVQLGGCPGQLPHQAARMIMITSAGGNPQDNMGLTRAAMNRHRAS